MVLSFWYSIFIQRFDLNKPVRNFGTTGPTVILQFHSGALCRHQLLQTCWLTPLPPEKNGAPGSSGSSVVDDFHHTSMVSRDGATVSELNIVFPLGLMG